MADDIDVGDIYQRISAQEAATGRLDEKLDGLVATLSGLQTSIDRIARVSQVPYIPLIMIVLAIIVPGAIAFNELEQLRARNSQIQIDYLHAEQIAHQARTDLVYAEFSHYKEVQITKLAALGSLTEIHSEALRGINRREEAKNTRDQARLFDTYGKQFKTKE